MKKNKIKTSIEKTNTKKIFSSFKEKFANTTEIPKYLLSNISKITVINDESLFIEGYKAIEEYYTHYIKISGNSINIIVDGKELDIKEITDEDILITGVINSVNFKKI